MKKSILKAEQRKVLAALVEMTGEQLVEDDPLGFNTIAAKNGLDAFVKYLREAEDPPLEHQVRALMRLIQEGSLALISHRRPN